MGQITKSFTSDRYDVSYPVQPEHDGIRLDQFLMERFENFSRQVLKKKIESGDVKIKERTTFPHKPSSKVYHGENVQVTTYNVGHEDEYWRGVKLRLDNPTILFEDKDVLVINKPPFMTTHPSGKHLFHCATVFYEDIYGHTIHSIHRLDRETSGTLILGKNPKATQKITDMFEKREVKKCYFFIAHKNKFASKFPFTAKQWLGMWENYLPRNYVHSMDEGDSRGVHAQTKFELIEEYGDYVVGLAFPKTGRQHQIRSHASFHGYPLLGDKMYNGDATIFMRFKDEIPTQDDHDKMQIPRHALHSMALHIPKVYNKPFIAPLPKDLADWLEINLYADIESLESKISQRIKELI
jgi:23S rRNA pseudouridine1911/1915/1917 synthase